MATEIAAAVHFGEQNHFLPGFRIIIPGNRIGNGKTGENLPVHITTYPLRKAAEESIMTLSVRKYHSKEEKQ